MAAIHPGPVPTTNEYEMDDNKIKYEKNTDGEVVAPVPDQLDNVEAFEVDEAETGITPAFTIVTSQWYRKNEQGTRTGIWFSCNALSLTLGAFIAYGFAEADLSGDLAIPGWQVIFIFMGCLTTAMGVVLALFLPDSPLTARFLTAQEKEVAIERIRSNQQSVGNHEYKLYQVKEAFMDPMVSLEQ
ncbi:hypothetical protein QFC24_006289 [Naganishia onofrii]|uniref:Uncharacterized protein n=1 Tax=Naganishia onofrii TaxID=1851511 RepID=A0ACC2X3Z0_9TREE|nr:hypothetical protein QFC24_006289 [Naganishia onofrii]